MESDILTNEQLWQAILGNLEVSLSKANFNTWFKNTSISNRAEDSITICVPSAFIRDWIADKFQAEMLKALKMIAPEIKFINYQLGVINKPAPEAEKPTIESVNPQPNPQQPQQQPVASPFTPQVNKFTQGNLPTNGLNPRYIFENFIIGKHNELAHAAAQAVAKSPGNQYNPLFIYGGVGLGKTHLMQAVGNNMLYDNPHAKIFYVSSEKFTNDYISAIQTKKTEEFKKRYRSVDMLLIDDIQFIAGKEGTQEEFFHTFNELRETGKQIILTSDRLPKDIPAIEERLVSRFEWGMVADIQAPDLETRMAILRTKMSKKGVALAEDILFYIAENIITNIRELEGALNRLVVYQQMQNKTLFIEQAREILANMVQAKKKITTLKKISIVVSEFYNLTIDDLIKQSRRKEFVKPRQIAMYLARKEISSSFPAIGEFFGGRDHTTVMHAVEKIDEIAKRDTLFKQELDLILDKLYTNN